jgi:hypothetical protein
MADDEFLTVAEISPTRKLNQQTVRNDEYVVADGAQRPPRRGRC